MNNSSTEEYSSNISSLEFKITVNTEGVEFRHFFWEGLMRFRVEFAFYIINK